MAGTSIENHRERTLGFVKGILTLLIHLAFQQNALLLVNHPHSHASRRRAVGETAIAGDGPVPLQVMVPSPLSKQAISGVWAHAGTIQMSIQRTRPVTSVDLIILFLPSYSFFVWPADGIQTENARSPDATRLRYLKRYSFTVPQTTRWPCIFPRCIYPPTPYEPVCAPRL